MSKITNLPSEQSIGFVLQAVALVLKKIPVTDGNAIRALFARCAILYLYIIWEEQAGSAACSRKIAESIAQEIDKTLAIHLLQRLGPGHRGLACVNAVLFWFNRQSSMADPPALSRPRTCCCCRTLHSQIRDYSPLVWQRLKIDAPVCSDCVAKLEQICPLYAQPEAVWCSVCGGRDNLGELTDGFCLCSECKGFSDVLPHNM